jgi:hypothetical protein
MTESTVNHISESGLLPLTIAQSKALFPALDEAPEPWPFTVTPELVLQVRRRDGRLVGVRDIKASAEPDYFFGTISFGQRIGFHRVNVFAEGMPPRQTVPFTPHHAAEARRLAAQAHSPSSIASALHVDQAEVEAAVGAPMGWVQK